MKKMSIVLIFEILLSHPLSAQHNHIPLIANSLERKLDEESLNPNAYLNSTVRDSNVTLVGRWPYGYCGAIKISGNFAYIGNGTVFEIVDISNPGSMICIGSVETPGYINGIAVTEQYAYVATYNGGLRIINITNPASPFEISFIKIGLRMEGVWINNNHAFVRNHNGSSRTMDIIDISDPHSPHSLGTLISTIWYDSMIKFYKQYAYFIKNNDMLIFDTDSLNSSSEIKIENITENFIYTFDIQGNYLYIIDYEFELFIFDISLPKSPKKIGQYNNILPWVETINVKNSYAYIQTQADSMQILDISDPSSPTELKCLAKISSNFDISDHYIFNAYSNGIHAIEVNTGNQEGLYDIGGICRNIQVVNKYLYTTNISTLQIYDIHNVSSPKKIALSDTILGSKFHFRNDKAYTLYRGGMRIYDYQSPTKLTPTDNPVRGNWDDLILFGNIGYLFNTELIMISSANYYFNFTMDIYELLPNPQKIDSILDYYMAWNIAISDSCLYILDFSNGHTLLVYDLKNPHKPKKIDDFQLNTDGEGLYVENSYLYVADVEVGLKIFEISKSDKFSIKEIGRTSKHFTGKDVVVKNNFAYLKASTSDLKIIDVSDPANPVETGFYQTGYQINNIIVDDRYIYVSDNYAGFYILSNDLITKTPEQKVKSVNFELSQNYPNPFNSSTTIRYTLNRAEKVTLKIFNLMGQEVATLVDAEQKAGKYQVTWSAAKFASGLYLCRLQTDSNIEIKKIVFQK